jgi:protease-4
MGDTMSTGGRIALAIGLFLILCLIALVALIAIVSLVAGGGFHLGGDRIALLRVEGLIGDLEHEVDLTRQYTEDSGIRAIVVRIDTGGGAVGASQELFQELLRAADRKPVVISMGNVAASGGYYVALAGDTIFANPGTVTGSIGVLFTHVDTSGLLDERLGLRFTEVTSRENKDMGSIWGPLDDADRALIEEMIGDVHGQFVDAIRERRTGAIRQALAEDVSAEAQITDEQIDEHITALCDGRPFTGEQALAWGFIDALGNLNDAIDHAARAAGITGEPNVVEWQPRHGLLGPLVQSVTREALHAVREEVRPRSALRYEMSR